VINMDVVTRYHGFITCHYNKIHKLHNHSNDASYNSAFYHTGWYYEHRKAFRRGLTAESRMHIAMDCRRGSLVKLCGLTRIKFYNPHTSVDKTRRRHENSIVSICPVLPGTHEALLCHCCHRHHQLDQGGCWVDKVQIKQGSIWCDCCDCDHCDCDMELKLML